jgi:hypothetical protein
MGHWIYHLSGLFTNVDGKGITNQSCLSLAAWFLFAKHDLVRFDLLVSQEVNCGLQVVSL